jgi:hypothetical protein
MNVPGIFILDNGVTYYLDFKKWEVSNCDGSICSKITFHICDILDDLMDEEKDINKIIKFVYTPHYKVKLFIDKNRND